MINKKIKPLNLNAQLCSRRVLKYIAAYFLILINLSISISFSKPLLQFHNLDKSDGLASSVVFDIAEDAEGFIWFATQDGLQKYDGNKLENFRFNPTEPNSLSNNIVRNLLFSKNGLLWVGTEDGVDIYNYKTDSFQTLSNYFPAKQKLASNQIREIYQTEDEIIWVGTGAGLSSINLKKREIINYPLAKVRSVFEDDFNRLWVGTLGEGLYLFDRVTEQFKLVDRYKDIEQLNGFNPGNESVVDIYQDSFGRLLVATWGNGLLRLNPETNTLTPFKIDLPSQFVRTIQQDEIGQLWIGTNKGILIRDTIEKRSQTIFSDLSNVISPNSDNITKIFQGKDNTLWLGTFGGGIARHIPKSRQFETYGPNIKNKFKPQDAVISAFYENVDGSLWVGTESAKLFKFNSSSHALLNYSLVFDDRAFEKPILTIYENPLGILFLGTTAGVYQFKKSENNSFKFIEKFNDSINEPVSFIREDQEGRLYIGYSNQGVQVYDINPQGEYSKSDIDLSRIKKPQAFLLAENNIFYIATQSEGIFKINNQVNDSIQLIPNTLDLNVLDISLDWQGSLWIAAWSKGVRVIRNGKIIHAFDELSGISNNTVYSIVADKNSNKIWASTNAGIFSIDLKTMNIDNFSFSDGLQANEFNPAGLLSKGGYIFFGGTNGFNRFYPKVIRSSDKISPVIITEFLKTNLDKSKSFRSSKAIDESRIKSLISIKHNEMPFSFSFSSPQYGNANSLEFRYRLKGLSDKWVLTRDNSRKAVFAHVPPGDYQFEVQVRAKNADWSESKAFKKLLIHPPFWYSTFAKIIYVLSIVLIFIIIFLRVRKRKRKDKLAQKALSDSEKRLRLSLWGAGHQIWNWDVESSVIHRFSEKNDQVGKVEKLSTNLKELKKYIHDYDLHKVKEGIRLHLLGATPYFEECYRIGNVKDGYRWVRDRGKIVERNSEKQPLKMSGTQVDISELHQKDEEIERLGQAFKSTSDGVWIRNSKLELIDCNPAYERITGFKKEEKEKEILWFPENENQPKRIKSIIEYSLKSKGAWQGEVWAERKSASPFPQKLSIDTILDEKGIIQYYVGVFTDITFRKKTEEELRRLANFDTLTGLPNRACLFDRLSQTLDKARIRNEKFAVFKIDIDNFKRVNDSFGQNTGNELIINVAKKLSNCIGGADTVARVGGDEFIVIQNDIDSFSEVASSADRILRELNLPIIIHGHELTLNFSVGITISPDDGLSADKLLRNADTAMYEAKKEVLNSSRFYSTDLNEKAQNKLSMENALRKAIDNQDIELFYQPKVDLRTGKVCGMEALARWHLAGTGNVSPDDFIKLAEETRLILPLGEYLFKKAVKQTKTWVEQGKMQGRMCFNLSAHQFWNRDLSGEIMEIMDFYKLDAKYIEFEITESACMEDVVKTISQMKKLRDMGFHMALDDFGTGYSSLAQLKTLPLDTLKVDKSFISKIENNNKDANLVKAIIDIANNLSLNVVIEGVESQKQCECLWQSRANIIQGFYFSPAVPHERMSQLLTKTWQKSDYLSSIDLNVTPIN